MRGAPKLLGVIAAAVLAAGLTACGGDGSTTTTTASTSNTTASQKASARKDQEKNGGRRNAQKSKESNNEGSASSGSKVAAAPLKVSGGGSDQFRTHGGDNSIQEFGAESDESELQAAAEALHGYYVARAEENWAAACSYLAKSLTGQLEQFAAQSKQFKGKGCAPIVKAFTRPLPSSARREASVIDAGSLRHEGEQSFLIYYGADKTAYAMPMKQEDGEWKVTALSGTPLG